MAWELNISSSVINLHINVFSKKKIYIVDLTQLNSLLTSNSITEKKDITANQTLLLQFKNALQHCS